MRVLIQRVTQASVAIAGETTAAIGAGLLVLVGIEEADEAEDIGWLTGKIARLRALRGKTMTIPYAFSVEKAGFFLC